MPFPHCERCIRKMIPWILNNRHYTLEVYRLGQEFCRLRDMLQRCFTDNQVAARVNLESLEARTAFPYLVRTVTFNNSNWASLYRNLRKAQR